MDDVFVIPIPTTLGSSGLDWIQFCRNPGGSGDDLAWVHRVGSTKTERTNTTTLKEAL